MDLNSMLCGRTEARQQKRGRNKPWFSFNLSFFLPYWYLFFPGGEFSSNLIFTCASPLASILYFCLFCSPYICMYHPLSLILHTIFLDHNLDSYRENITYICRSGQVCIFGLHKLIDPFFLLCFFFIFFSFFNSFRVGKSSLIFLFCIIRGYINLFNYRIGTYGILSPFRWSFFISSTKFLRTK